MTGNQRPKVPKVDDDRGSPVASLSRTPVASLSRTRACLPGLPQTSLNGVAPLSHSDIPTMTVKTKVSPRELEPYDLDTPLRGAWRHKLKIKPVYDATLKVKTNGPTPRRVWCGTPIAAQKKV